MTSTWIESGPGSDMDRRELFTDARDISKTIPGGTLDDTQYLAQLVQRGQEKLAENGISETFAGEADTTGIYVYDEDFFMGDIVQTADEYGHEAQTRVTEIIHSQDPSGIKVYPSFSAI